MRGLLLPERDLTFYSALPIALAMRSLSQLFRLSLLFSSPVSTLHPFDIISVQVETVSHPMRSSAAQK